MEVSLEKLLIFWNNNRTWFITEKRKKEFSLRKQVNYYNVSIGMVYWSINNKYISCYFGAYNQ